uniref:RING-type domain-containing protein n=1 Tax=Homalodisca liturata TaxID=320908 RepID=A0A1B6IYM8_9HEMI
METITLEEQQALLRGLLEAINCPVCFKILQPLCVIQCINGHWMCKDCRVKLSLCPTCRGSFSPYNNNSSLNQVLELFPHMCKFEGCEEIVRPNDDHETWCGFRPTKCNLPICN